MTVGQLIALLAMVKDKSTRVIVNGYEGGYCDVNSIVFMDIALDYNTESWYGPHERLEYLNDHEREHEPHVPAILISTARTPVEQEQEE